MARKATIENLQPFKKGQSGNPNGRPKKLPEIDKLLADVLGEEIRLKCNHPACEQGRMPDGAECPKCDGGRKTKTNQTSAEAILRKLRAMAASGNIRAAEILLDRAYGRAKQAMEVNGELRHSTPSVTIQVLPPTVPTQGDGR